MSDSHGVTSGNTTKEEGSHRKLYRKRYVLGQMWKTDAYLTSCGKSIKTRAMVTKTDGLMVNDCIWQTVSNIEDAEHRW